MQVTQRTHRCKGPGGVEEQKEQEHPGVEEAPGAPPVPEEVLAVAPVSEDLQSAGLAHAGSEAPAAVSEELQWSLQQFRAARGRRQLGHRLQGILARRQEGRGAQGGTRGQLGGPGGPLAELQALTLEDRGGVQGGALATREEVLEAIAGGQAGGGGGPVGGGGYVDGGGGVPGGQGGLPWPTTMEPMVAFEGGDATSLFLELATLQ